MTNHQSTSTQKYQNTRHSTSTASKFNSSYLTLYKQVATSNLPANTTFKPENHQKPNLH